MYFIQIFFLINYLAMYKIFFSTPPDESTSPCFDSPDNFVQIELSFKLYGCMLHSLITIIIDTLNVVEHREPLIFIFSEGGYDIING